MVVGAISTHATAQGAIPACPASVRFILLLAGAGAAVAILRHLTRQRAEEAKPFFADSYVPPAPAPVAQEPVVEPAPGSRSRSSTATPVVEEPVAEQSYVEAAPIVVQPTPVPEEPVLEAAPVEEPGSTLRSPL